MTYGDLMGTYGDISKSKKLLGFKTKIKLKEGLLRMWENEKTE